MTETIEEMLADVRADMNYQRSSLITVGDVAKSMVKLVDVVKEINERIEPPEYVISIDPRAAIRIDDIPKETEVEKLRRKIFDIEVREDLVTTELERQITFLKTELSIAMQIRHNLKSQISELRNNYVYQTKRRYKHIDALEADRTQLYAIMDRQRITMKQQMQDSETLKKVVALVKTRQDHLMASDRVALNRLSYIVGDYLDAPKTRREIV